ncbi:hypothetical protein Tco_0408648 [Tanacetum coccineum]
MLFPLRCKNKDVKDWNQELQIVMAHPLSPDHAADILEVKPAQLELEPVVPDHAHVLTDHLPGAPEPEPAFPDHVVNFPEDDLAVEIEEGPEEDQDMDIDEEDLEEDQVMDFEHSIYEIGGPSSAVPEASHIGGHPLSIVTSHDARHHWELVALHVRLEGVETIQTDLRRSEEAIMRDIRWYKGLKTKQKKQ